MNMVFLGITHCRKCWAKLEGEIGLCESCRKHEEIENMEKQLEKNECEYVDKKVYIDGVELPKMERVKTQTEFDLSVANERLKCEMDEKYQLERGIIEFVKILGKRSM